MLRCGRRWRGRGRGAGRFRSHGGDGGGAVAGPLVVDARSIGRAAADSVGFDDFLDVAQPVDDETRHAEEFRGWIGVHRPVEPDIPQLAEPFIRRRAIRHLEKKRVVIFAAGTGNPFFTTDSAAALRAAEMKADVIFKATKVDGIYDADPVKNPNAVRYDKITYQEVLEKQLKVMDASAISLCMDNDLPIMVFNMRQSGNIVKAVGGDLTIGTLVSNKK